MQDTVEGVMNNEDVEENNRSILEAAKAELDEAKKELNRAKENAMQSWLDSKPLIDELEKQKTNLANAQQNSNTPEIAIVELESQLEITEKSIKSKREDHVKTENMIYEINHALDQMCNDMERLKHNIKKEKQTRAKLKQTLHLRRRTVQTLQLTLQAVLLELDAVEVSTAKAFQLINHSENNTSDVQLSHRDYYALKRRAEERKSQANWRVSVSMEQKLAAEATREFALSRLNHFYSSKSWSRNRRNITGQWHKEKEAKTKDVIVQDEVTTNINSASPKSHAKSLVKSEGGSDNTPKKQQVILKQQRSHPFCTE
ncbi:putative WEB family protein [Medicago truncatula]|uniref:Putative WEB family protein n=1 Tax=Medicago truncatula TaxID=3880 RepID=A0A396GMA9_MEDTR|nr:putative WEB family protein [Medicago truncatula]